MNSIPKVFQDPKFWTSVVSIMTALGIYTVGGITAEQFVDALQILTGIFVGGEAVQKGLAQAGKKTTVVTAPTNAPVAEQVAQARAMVVDLEDRDYDHG